MIARERPADVRIVQTLRGHVIATLVLAGPVIVARAGFVILQIVDTAMTGRAGTQELAFIGIAGAVQMVLMLLALGMLRGIPVLVAQARGAGDLERCGEIWRSGLLHALVLGLLMVPVSLSGEPILRLVGQDPELARGGGEVMTMFAIGLPFFFVWTASTMFLEGVRHPIPAMLITIAANILNAGVNWVFIFGHLGAPEMGASGALLATSIIRVLMFAALLAYVFSRPQLGIYNVRGGVAGLWNIGRRLRSLGYPLAIAAGVEALAFATMTVFAGLLGTERLAVFQIVITSIAFIFMAAVGVGAATAVRVGYAVGRQDARETKWAGWTGLGLVTAIMILASIAILAAPAAVIGIYSNDPAIVALAPGVLTVAALLLIFDGGQGVLMGALRGTGDVWIPSLIQLLSFWMVMVPVGALFSFVFDWGPRGLMGAVMAGVFVAFVALSTRFLIVSGRAIRRL